MEFEDCRIERTDRYVHVAFGGPRPVLSSAVLGGGLVTARRAVNLKVAANRGPDASGPKSPEQTLAGFCRDRGWDGPVVGMMTAASMDSFRLAVSGQGENRAAALVTAGLSNALRAGDPAGALPMAAGTINIIVLCVAALRPEAMVEAVQLAAEAKAATLMDLGVRSLATGALATGTGTDCLAVVSGPGPAARYCGKHLPLGEAVARAVMDALSDSLKRCAGKGS
ncbi:MAG: adenosylcobinamide amidohydrolase [Desulfovibrionaceae bacterium]|nr:adenosylcobinamide amidohydrolase [Desulfovibrionaceae bacterium]